MAEQSHFTETEAKAKIGKRIMAIVDISNGFVVVASYAHGEVVDVLRNWDQSQGESYRVVIEWANMRYHKRITSGGVEQRVDWHMHKDQYEKFLQEEAA